MTDSQRNTRKRLPWQNKHTHWQVRFWNYVDKTDTCWLWRGSKHSGYGVINVPGRGRPRAHRLSYEMAIGPIPDGLLVCHTCDIRECVRPEHLFLGTAKDNTADCIAKGRLHPGNPGKNVTHCPQGHEYNAANTCFRSNGHRACRRCALDRYYARKARTA